MPDENEQNALAKIKAYLDAGHSLDAVREAGWAFWIDHLEAKGYDLKTGQLNIAPPDASPVVETESAKEETPAVASAAKISEAASTDAPICAKCGAERVGTRPYCVNCPTKWPDGTPSGLAETKKSPFEVIAKPIRAWWAWSGQRQATWSKVLAYGGPLGVVIILIVIISVASASGGGNDEQLVVVQGTPAAGDADVSAAEASEPTDTPKPTWESGPVTEETVRGALDSLDDLGLVRPDIDPDNVTFLSVIPDVDGAGYIVAIEFKPGTTLGETDFLTVAGESTLIAMARLFANPEVDRVKVSAMADLISALGNESTAFLTTATINRAKADQINWQGFADRQLFDNKHIFCFADAFIIRPQIYDKLKDTGCLPGPLRSEG